MSLESIIVFALILGVLIWFHELGHFITAKLAGIRVEVFAFGLGPRLLRVFRRGDTEYAIHLLPLGGFVKLAGMETGEEDIADGFQAQPIWKRAVVIFAGPLFSFVLGVAVLLFVGVHWGFQDYTQPEPRIGSVQPLTEAARVDLRAGDRVLEINGIRITQGTQMTQLIHSKPGEELTLLIDRDGKTINMIARPRWVVQYLGAQWSFMKGVSAVVDNVAKPSAAENAGIQQDDTLVSINGKSIVGGPEMVAAIRSNGGRVATIVLNRNRQSVAVAASPDVQWVRFLGPKWVFPGGYAIEEGGKTSNSAIQPDDLVVGINHAKITSGEDMLKAIKAADGHALAMVVSRDGVERLISVTPTAADLASVRWGVYTTTGLLGFLPAPKLVKKGFTESMKEGFVIVGRIVQMLAKTLTSKRIKEDIGGPVMIAKVTQTSVALGPYWVLLLLGSLSLSLAVINLVPIPAILDGGHLILLGIEAVRKKRWSRNQMAVMQMVGFAIVAVLIALVFVSDITKMVSGQIPQ